MNGCWVPLVGLNKRIKMALSYLVRPSHVSCFILFLFFCVLFLCLLKTYRLRLHLFYWSFREIFSFDLLLDPMRVLFRMVVTLISISVVLFSSSYLSEDHNYSYFLIILITFVFSINVLIFIPNLVTLLIGWDGLGLSSYLLVAYYQNNVSLGRAMITALTNRLGDSFLMVRVSSLYFLGNYEVLGLFEISRLTCLFLIFASYTKRAQIPFSA
jgi:NADH-ubiquinone oxidoreductase chain 5